MKYKNILLTILLVGLVALSACTAPTPTGVDPIEKVLESSTGGVFDSTRTTGDDITKFSSEEEYIAFLQEYGNTGFNGFARSGFGGNIAVDLAMDVTESAIALSAPAVEGVSLDDGALDFSETNNQVSGIDEADIIKTDGNYIYTVTDNTLFIVNAYPGEDAQVVATIEFEDRPQGLFIHEDIMAVFGTDREYTIRGYPSLEPTLTYFELYDISDRTNPTQTKTFSFEGDYFNARLIDDTVYFVTKEFPRYRDEFPLPIILEDGVARSMPVDRIAFFPGNYNSPQLVFNHMIDMDGELIDSMSVAVDSPQTLYMSSSHMFLVGQEYVNEWELEQEILKEQAYVLLQEKDRKLIADIKGVNPLILSSGEKENKIMNVYYTAIARLDEEAQETFYEDVETALEEELKSIKYFQYTTITQLELDDDGYDDVETGTVPGQIVNQFSLDQYDDHLRIATTINSRWDRFTGDRSDSTTNVWTLDDELDITGSLEGLAPTERIYSTRFIGDKLYMVTFRQVDPFFVIDLSNPQNPENLGELKIPGFSRYLHPYDENHIIGIGQEADSQGRTTGLKISLFDVTDVTDPQEVAKFVTDEKYAQSTALYEHKAFLFSREKNMLVIPAYSREFSWWDENIRGEDSYNGAFVFNIDESDIELRGLIDHSSFTENTYGAAVERSLYIEDLLYTKSANVIRINNIDDLNGVTNVELERKGNGDIIFY